MPRRGEAHAMSVPFTLLKRSPTTKRILRVLMQQITSILLNPRRGFPFLPEQDAAARSDRMCH